MLNRIGALTLSSAIYLIAEGLLSLPINSSEEPQVPRLTLEIPISGPSVIYTDFISTSLESARKLCASAEGRATGRPYGFNKVRYINTEYGIEILGCITNNSTRTLETFSFESTITSPIPLPFPLEGRLSPEGKLLSDILTLGPIIPPGQTRFFRNFILPSYTNTATTIIKHTLPPGRRPGQSKTYPPLQQLNIIILR
jgi:hypothetical protein